MTTDQAELIDELRAFLEGRADTEFFTDSPYPQPNQEMRLLMRLNELFPEEK